MACPIRTDLCLTQGTSLDEQFAIPGIEFTDECSGIFVLKASPLGREFFRATSDDGVFDFNSIELADCNGDGELYGGIRLTIPADALAHVFPLRYWFSISVQCPSTKIVAVEGFFELEPNIYVQPGVPCNDVMSEVSGCSGTISILSVNDKLEICCGREEPLFIEIVGTKPIASIDVDMPGGEVRFEARMKGKWVNDPLVRLEALRYRVRYQRYGPLWFEKKPWERDNYVGGSLTTCCDTCGEPCDESFTLTLTAENTCGQSSSQEFSVSVHEAGSCSQGCC